MVKRKSLDKSNLKSSISKSSKIMKTLKKVGFNVDSAKTTWKDEVAKQHHPGL